MQTTTIDLSQFSLPDIGAALEAGLRVQEDSWDKTVLHVTDLGYSIPFPDGLCARQLWLRLRSAPQRPLHRGELWMFDAAREMHLRLTSLVGWAFSAVNSGAMPPSLIELVPGVVTLRGWKMALVEHSLKRRAGEDLGLAPDPHELDDGTLDVELWGPDGEILEVDWKTARGSAFQHIDSRGPYEKHKMQVRTYARARAKQEPERTVIGSLLFYADREGQNFGRAFGVSRDDAAVEAAVPVARAIAESQMQPPGLEPSLRRVQNKGPDALYLDSPWPCGRCVFLDHSCPGALPPDVRDFNRVAANITDKGELKFKPECPPAAIPIIEDLLWRGQGLPALEASVNKEQP